MSIKAHISLIASLGLVLSSISLVISLISIAWRISNGDNILTEFQQRLEDVEVEHDIVLQVHEDVETVVEANSPQKLVAVPPLCLEMPDPGPCNLNIVRWYFLSREGNCFQFPWGGCAGNNNRFLNREQCLATCQVGHVPSLPVRQTRANNNVEDYPVPVTHGQDRSRCQHPPDAGPCKDRLTRYYYDGSQCNT